MTMSSQIYMTVTEGVMENMEHFSVVNRGCFFFSTAASNESCLEFVPWR